MDTQPEAHGQKQSKSRYPCLCSQKKATKRAKVNMGRHHRSHPKGPNSPGVNLYPDIVAKRCVWTHSTGHSVWMMMAVVHRPYQVALSVVQRTGCRVYHTRKRFRFQPRLALVPARILIVSLRTIISACRRFTILHGRSLTLELLNQRSPICLT
jgi:hypothetical protein